jgi:hypothetical protein
VDGSGKRNCCDEQRLEMDHGGGKKRMVAKFRSRRELKERGDGQGGQRRPEGKLGAWVGRTRNDLISFT